VALAVAAALRAPDHGRLRPWRFLGVSGEARRALGAAMAAALARLDPQAGTERLAREAAKPLRAPFVLVAAAAIVPGHRIPEWEQRASAAAGVMNVLNAFHFIGYGAVWLSSPAFADVGLLLPLGLAEADQLLGTLHVGTLHEALPPAPRPEAGSFWRVWGGPIPGQAEPTATGAAP